MSALVASFAYCMAYPPSSLSLHSSPSLCVHVYAHACGEWKSMLSSNHYLFFYKILSLNLVLTDWLYQLAIDFQSSVYFQPSGVGIGIHDSALFLS